MADKPIIINFECVRGDTFMKRVRLKTRVDGELVDYELQEGDSLLFGLAKGYKYEKKYDLILEVPITDRLELTKSQTEELAYGMYNYDIEFTRGTDGRRKTLFQGTFEITKESI